MCWEGTWTSKKATDGEGVHLDCATAACRRWGKKTGPCLGPGGSRRCMHGGEVEGSGTRCRGAAETRRATNSYRRRFRDDGMWRHGGQAQRGRSPKALLATPSSLSPHSPALAHRAVQSGSLLLVLVAVKGTLV